MYIVLDYLTTKNFGCFLFLLDVCRRVFVVDDLVEVLHGLLLLLSEDVEGGAQKFHSVLDEAR